MAIISIAIFILANLLLSLPALADENKDTKYGLDTTAQVAEIKTDQDVADIVGKLIQTTIGFVGVVFLIFIVVSGFQWMGAGGNSEIIAKARKRMINAAIGLVIILAAYSITWFVMESITTTTQ